MSGMQVLVRPGDLHFNIGKPAHSAVYGRHLVGNHSRVRNQNHRSRQFLPVISRPLCQGWAADFLLAFEYELDIMLQKAIAAEVFESLDVHKKLPLVVISTSGIDGTVPDFGFKRV